MIRAAPLALLLLSTPPSQLRRRHSVAQCQAATTFGGSGGGEGSAAAVFAVAQHAANDPSEDRAYAQHLPVGAWWFACFDGHGGWQCSEFVQHELHRSISVELQNRLGLGHEENNMLGSVERIAAAGNGLNGNGLVPLRLVGNNNNVPGSNNNNNNVLMRQENNRNGRNEVVEYEGKIRERLVQDALVAAFERTDRVYKNKVQGAFEVGFGRDTRAGACALGALFVDGTMYVANLGDCRAVLAVKQQTEASRGTGLTPDLAAKTESATAKNQDDDIIKVVNEVLQQAGTKNSSVDPETEDMLRGILRKEVERRSVKKGGETDVAASTVKSKGTINEAGFDDHQIDPIEESEEDRKKRKGTVEISPAESALVSVVRFLTGRKDEKDSGADKKDKRPKEYLAVQVTHDHNAREKREQKKLELEHPDEDDVVICRPNRPDVCYIKGKLQPTRAFGDYYLKYSEFMRSPSQHSSAGRYIMPPYTPPYISAVPDIFTLKMRRGVDDFMIIATDGVWDFLSCQDAVDIVAANLRCEGGSLNQASEALKMRVLELVASKSGIILEELLELPQGRDRRARHDDITILVIDLTTLLNMYQFG